MSRNTPAPVALTAAMLVAAAHRGVAKACNAVGVSQLSPGPHVVHEVANLASAIHRLAPACRKLAVAECNGEWHDGQRAATESGRLPHVRTPRGLRDPTLALDDSIADYATRLDRRIAKLNAELAPFGYQLIRSGDPRGACLSLAEMPVSDSATHYAIG